MSESSFNAEMTEIISSVFPRGSLGWDVIRVGDDEIRIRVYGTVEGRSARHAVIQRRLLEQELRDWSRQFSEKVHISIQMDDAYHRLEEAMESALRATGGSSVRLATIDVKKTGETDVQVMMEQADQKIVDRLKRLAASVLSGNDLELRNLQILEVGVRARIPELQLLVQVKKLQPVTVDDLMKAIRRTLKSDDIAQEDVLRAGDRLRHRGLLVYDSRSKTYSLTFQGLTAIPGSPGSGSPDVARVLELGRRRR